MGEPRGYRGGDRSGKRDISDIDIERKEMVWLKLIADMLHLSSIIILLLKIRQSKNCVGRREDDT